MVSDNKTKATDKPVQAFLETIENDNKRADCLALSQLMQEITGQQPQMWGDAIIGFGKYHYKYASGREGDWFVIGFSPRKNNLALYGIGGSDEFKALLSKLGKYKTAKSCLYINSLKDVDLATLKQVVQRTFERRQNMNLG